MVTSNTLINAETGRSMIRLKGGKENSSKLEKENSTIADGILKFANWMLISKTQS